MSELFGCPVEDCDKEYKTEAKLDKHLAKAHPDHKEPEGSEEPIVLTTNDDDSDANEGAGEGQAGDDFQDEKAAKETANAAVKSAEERLQDMAAENAALLKELRKLKGDKLPKSEAKPLKDEVLTKWVRDAAQLVDQRNKKRISAARRKQEEKYDESEKLTQEAHELDLKLLPLAAKIADVEPDRIMCLTRRTGSGAEEQHGVGVNVRKGRLGIVLTNGSKLRVDILDVSQALWTNVHDGPSTPETLRTVAANKTPNGWLNRPQVPVMR